jgi:hypothetical protein
MKKFDYENYSVRIKKEYENCINLQMEYLKDNNLENKVISSLEHPLFFEIQKKYEDIKQKLDNPLLDYAYFQKGDELTFVKKNTYTERVKSNLFFHKKLSAHCFEANLNFEHIEKHVFYENVISKGVVKDFYVNSNGDIIYNLENVFPKCPEDNPVVNEIDVISFYRA